MTGFGRGEAGYQDQTITVEVRSVNSRYREILIRMPKSFQMLEEELRSLVSNRVGRGRVEVSVGMAGNGQVEFLEIDVNVGLLRSYVRALNRIKEELGLQEALSVSTLLGLKDVLTAKPRDPELETVKGLVIDALSRALAGLDDMKGSEGARLAEDLSARIDRLEGAVAEVKKRLEGASEQIYVRLMERLKKLLKDTGLDESRVAQEAAIMADRADVSEELVRITSHIAQFREYLKAEEPVGRRLDFLLQEMHREVNTLSVKASDAWVSGSVVEMKAELEKIREQVQNIE